MFRLAFSVALLCLGLNGCTRLITEPLPSQDIDGSFRQSTVTWTSGAKVTFGYKVYPYNGRVALCGAWAESPGGDYHQSQFNDRMVQTRRAMVDGETLANDLGWFAKATYQAGGLPQGQANCRLTDRKWQRSYATSVELVATRTRYKILD